MSTNSTVYTMRDAAPSVASTSASTPSKFGRSASSMGASVSEDITQFIFLNPIWLMMACKSILRHNLQEKLMQLAKQKEKLRKKNQGFYANTGCPVISRTEALELWNDDSVEGREKVWLKITKEAIKTHQMSPFNFLIRLLVTFNVFVPIDLTIETMNLGGVRINELFVSDDSETIDDR